MIFLVALCGAIHGNQLLLISDAAKEVGTLVRRWGVLQSEAGGGGCLPPEPELVFILGSQRPLVWMKTVDVPEVPRTMLDHSRWMNWLRKLALAKKHSESE